MGSGDVTAQVTEITKEILTVREGDIAPDTSFVDDLGADETDLEGLFMSFEEEFGIEIPDDKAAQLRTIQQVVQYIEARTDAK